MHRKLQTSERDAYSTKKIEFRKLNWLWNWPSCSVLQILAIKWNKALQCVSISSLYKACKFPFWFYLNKSGSNTLYISYDSIWSISPEIFFLIIILSPLYNCTPNIVTSHEKANHSIVYINWSADVICYPSMKHFIT